LGLLAELVLYLQLAPSLQFARLPLGLLRRTMHKVHLALLESRNESLLREDGCGQDNTEAHRLRSQSMTIKNRKLRRVA